MDKRNPDVRIGGTAWKVDGVQARLFIINAIVGCIITNPAKDIQIAVAGIDQEHGARGIALVSEKDGMGRPIAGGGAGASFTSKQHNIRLGRIRQDRK